ncbi:pantetheine-phosphate adenylyltransferase [Treponema brennaborense]|uniref:Phosphopantetheine adenylyltransferase n=1 Tax=Treponema brennaborense (strain DSM 12168 / CIP 105900 / DD5/3) TaxID=906968 RepID=F4LN75_TREBD|nr:pantetheine-phosphate adenylyltransferase [Treponema brennaborense]AEE16840.1 Phosphopantetheine adenylyltransferase [Treponema brennaborense DSM 12168]
MITAVFPGSFDPPTFGHLNIIERARTIFSEIHVVVAVNKEKRYLFSAEERVALLQKLTAHWDNVSVHTCDTLIVEYAKTLGARVLLRGIRNVSDFSYEFDLSLMNKALASDLETIFMPTEPRFFVLKSSSIKELASFGGDVSAMVPESVARALERKFSK